MEEVRDDKIEIFADHNALLLIGQIGNQSVSRMIPFSKIQCVNGIMTRSIECSAEHPRKLGIQQESHAATGSRLFTLLIRAA